MTQKRKILILCTGNSCRSQMAEWILKSLDPALDVASAGIHPAPRVHPKAVTVMAEIGVDISQTKPTSVEKFIGSDFDAVVTVCDHAKETCPAFTGRVGRRVHMGFEDPTEATGTEEEIMRAFRTVRDQIQEKFSHWHTEFMKEPARPRR